MTRETLGRIIGYILLIFVSFGVPYALTSFVLWNADVSQWEVGGRAIIVGAGLAVMLVWLLNKITPSEQ